jgi:hypothetical protein
MPTLMMVSVFGGSPWIDDGVMRIYDFLFAPFSRKHFHLTFATSTFILRPNDHQGRAGLVGKAAQQLIEQSLAPTDAT